MPHTQPDLELKEQKLEIKEINLDENHPFIGGCFLSEEEKSYEKTYAKNPTKEIRSYILRKLLSKINEGAATFSALENIYRAHINKNYLADKRHPWLDKVFACFFNKGQEKYTASKIRFIEELHEKAFRILQNYKRDPDAQPIPIEWISMNFLQSEKEHGVSNEYLKKIKDIINPKQKNPFVIPTGNLSTQATFFSPLFKTTKKKPPTEPTSWKYYVPPKVEQRPAERRYVWEITRYRDGSIRTQGYNYNKPIR